MPQPRPQAVPVLHHLALILFCLLVLSRENSSTRAAEAHLATHLATNTPISTITLPNNGPSPRFRAPSRTGSAPVPSPTLPSQCQECHGPNNTSGMTCLFDTQCIPTELLCDPITRPCLDSSMDNDTEGDDPILCKDQLCYSSSFLPLPAPGEGKLDLESDKCVKGSYFTLFGPPDSSQKYTLSCVVQDPVPVSIIPPKCNPWEYQDPSGFCFLSTCGPGLDCEPPFVCQKTHPDNLHGLCRDPDGSSGGLGGPEGPMDGGSNGHYSSQEYLVQGLLIGICSLGVGVGLGVGFWRYRRKSLRSPWATTAQGTLSLASNSPPKHSAWPSFFRVCGKKRQRRGTVSSLETIPTRDQPRDSLADSESREGSLRSNERRRSSIFFAGRWRWGAQSAASPGGYPMIRSMAPSGMTIVPEMDPPPLYHHGPDLPAYGDNDTMIMTHMATRSLSTGPHQQQSNHPRQSESSSRSVDSDHSRSELTEMPPLTLVRSGTVRSEQEGIDRLSGLARPVPAQQPWPTSEILRGPMVDTGATTRNVDEPTSPRADHPASMPGRSVSRQAQGAIEERKV